MVLGDISDALRVVQGLDSETRMLQRDFQLVNENRSACFEAQIELSICEVSSRLESCLYRFRFASVIVCPQSCVVDHRVLVQFHVLKEKGVLSPFSEMVAF